MQLGAYSFGDLAPDPLTGDYTSTAQAMRNLLEAIKLADEVGLDYFGVGEHHIEIAPASAASTLLAGAATVTRRILLGSSVTVLSTDDPVRLYQQFATVAALSNGRAEITAGRGSSTESYPLFGYQLEDYDTLFAEKLDLLLTIDKGDPVTWSGTVRPALDDAIVVPRPDGGHLPIWLGTGGNPGSSVRAGSLGLPVAYGIIGGRPARFAPLAGLYRKAFAASGPHSGVPQVSVASPGLIGRDETTAREAFWPGFHRLMEHTGKTRGFPPPDRRKFDVEASPGGALFVGGPEQIAERIIELHHTMGHMRHFFQMDWGGLPQKDFLTSIELLGTQVKPLVDRELGPEPEDLTGPAQR